MLFHRSETKCHGKAKPARSDGDTIQSSIPYVRILSPTHRARISGISRTNPTALPQTKMQSQELTLPLSVDKALSSNYADYYEDDPAL